MDPAREPAASSIALTPEARSITVANADPYAALDQVLTAFAGMGPVDLALLFVSARFARFLPGIVAGIREQLRPRALAGCTAAGIIGEEEGGPAISLLAMRLPGAVITNVRLGEWLRDADAEPERWRDALDLPEADVNGLLLLVDPYRTDAQSLLSGLHRAYPSAPIAGGVASGLVTHRQTWIIADEEIAGEGAVAVAIGGDYTLRPLVSQGCDPIGETWTITGASKQWIDSIARQPAMDVLLDALRTIPPEQRDAAGRNLFIGLAADEYKDAYERGDFLIRGITGIDHESGAIATNALPRTGQTLQFQVRDARTARADLKHVLERAARDAPAPVAALLCSSSERNAAFFGEPNADTAALARHFPTLPVTGITTSGEIGPVGRKPFLHGFTAVAALVVRR
jgi:small ligand-binding sensory domain FIST